MTTGEKISIALKKYNATHISPLKDKPRKESTKALLAERTRNYFKTHRHPREGHICSAEEVANIKAGCKGKMKEFYRTRPHHMEGKELSLVWKTSIAKGVKEFYKTHKHHQLGRVMPEDVRQRIRTTLTGQPGHMLNKKQPVSFFSKMAKYWNDPVWIENCAKKQRGEKSRWWKGGVSVSPYPVGWRSSLKKFIRRRDGWRCKNPFCRNGSGAMHVHHIDYNKDNLSEDNLITLCLSCHAKTNQNRAFYTFLFQNALANFYRCQEANKIEKAS